MPVTTSRSASLEPQAPRRGSPAKAWAAAMSMAMNSGEADARRPAGPIRTAALRGFSREPCAFRARARRP